MRCVTFPSTSSSVAAAPLCRYGALAKTEMSEGTLKPSTPRAWIFAALLARISLLDTVREQSGIEGADAAQEPDQLRVDDLGGGRRRRVVQRADRPVLAAVAVLAALRFENHATELRPDVVAANRRDRRAHAERQIGRDGVEVGAQPAVGGWAQIGKLREARGAFRNGGAIGSILTSPPPPETARTLRVKSWTSSRTADQLNAR